MVATLALLPNAPLKESTSYMVVLTNQIKGTDGYKLKVRVSYIIAKSQVPLTGGDLRALEPIRLLVNNMEDVAGSSGYSQREYCIKLVIYYAIHYTCT